MATTVWSPRMWLPSDVTFLPRSNNLGFGIADPLEVKVRPGTAPALGVRLERYGAGRMARVIEMVLATRVASLATRAVAGCGSEVAGDLIGGSNTDALFLAIRFLLESWRNGFAATETLSGVGRGSLGDGLPQHQKARLLTFDRTLIDAMSFEMSPAQVRAASRLAGKRVTNPTILGIRERCRRLC